MILKTGAICGAQIGHRTVFTKQGAIDKYNLFLDVCYSNLTPESAKTLFEAETDLINADFTYDEIEAMENEYLESRRNV